MCDEVESEIATGRCVGMMCADFSKAFDLTSRELVIGELMGFGVPGYLLRYIREFLSERVAAVELKTYGGVVVSEELKSEHGIVQGSRLGPTLFIIVINSLIRRYEEARGLSGIGVLKPYCFADDTTVVVSASSRKELVSGLQMALDTFSISGQTSMTSL